MIAKLFKRFSIYSVLSSVLILCIISYLYSDFDLQWVSFQIRSLNFFIILGLLILTTNSIRRIFRYTKLENKAHYYLLLYPLIVLSFPIDQFDIRILLSSTLFFSGWASFREYIDAKNSISTKNVLTKLLDSIILISFSSIVFYENIFLLLFPLVALIFSKKSISGNELGIIFVVPGILFFTCYQLLLIVGFDSYFFYSLLSEYSVSFSNSIDFSLVYEKLDLLIIFILFLVSVVLGLKRRLDYDSRTLEYDGLAYFVLLLLIIGLSRNRSSMLLHYISLPLTYYINSILVIDKKGYLSNFLLILLTISFLLFNFV